MKSDPNSNCSRQHGAEQQLLTEMSGVRALVQRLEARNSLDEILSSPGLPTSTLGGMENSPGPQGGGGRSAPATPLKTAEQHLHGWFVQIEIEAGREFPVSCKKNAYVCVSLLGNQTALETAEGELVVDHNVSKLNSAEHVTKAANPPRWNVNPQMKTKTVKHQLDPAWNDR